MNERIKELAEQAFMVCLKGLDEKYEQQLERFAELIRQDEREACAKLCEEKALYFQYDFIPPYDVADSCAEEIRARGGEMKDGIALENIAHPEGDSVPDDHEINPDSLETVEIDIPIDERIKQLAEQAGYLPDMFGIGHWDMPECIKFAELATWLYDNYRQDEAFWKTNPYGWKRWQAVLEFMDSEDHTDQLPAFKEYIEKLDNLRKTDFRSIFPEIKHLL
jgi:hypothetical protein